MNFLQDFISVYKDFVEVMYDNLKRTNANLDEFIKNTDTFTKSVQNNIESFKKNPKSIYTYYMENAPYFDKFDPYLRNYFNENYFSDNDKLNNTGADDKKLVKDLFTTVDKVSSEPESKVDKTFVKDIISIYKKFLKEIMNIDVDLNIDDIKDINQKKAVKLLKIFVNSAEKLLPHKVLPKHVYAFFRDSMPYFNKFEPYLREHIKDEGIAEISKQLSEDIFEHFDKQVEPNVWKKQTQPVYPINFEYKYEDIGDSKTNNFIEYTLNNIKKDPANLNHHIDLISKSLNDLGIDSEDFNSELDNFKLDIEKNINDNNYMLQIEKEFFKFIYKVIPVYLISQSKKFLDDNIEEKLNKFKSYKDDFIDLIKNDEENFSIFQIYYNNIHYLLTYFKHFSEKFFKLVNLCLRFENNNSEFNNSVYAKNLGLNAIVIKEINIIIKKLNYIKNSKKFKNGNYVDLNDNFKANFEEEFNDLLKDLDEIIKFIKVNNISKE